MYLSARCRGGAPSSAPSNSRRGPWQRSASTCQSTLQTASCAPPPLLAPPWWVLFSSPVSSCHSKFFSSPPLFLLKSFTHFQQFSEHHFLFKCLFIRGVFGGSDSIFQTCDENRNYKSTHYHVDITCITHMRKTSVIIKASFFPSRNPLLVRSTAAKCWWKPSEFDPFLFSLSQKTTRWLRQLILWQMGRFNY